MLREEKIWILEDDPGSRFVYQDSLGLRYRVDYFEKISEFQGRVRNSDERDLPNLLIADLRLPDGNFLKLLSSEEPAIPIEVPYIVVSAISDLDTLRWCLERKARDYLVKPFSREELIVKVERLLTPDQGLETDFQLDSDHLNVLREGRRSEPLTLKEFQILRFLNTRDGARCTRERIVSHVWRDIQVTNKTFDVHLFNLRKKVRPLGIEIRFHSARSCYQIETMSPQC